VSDKGLTSGLHQAQLACCLLSVVPFTWRLMRRYNSTEHKQEREFSVQSAVAVFDVSRGIRRAVQQALDAVDWRSSVKEGMPTCFKVNLTHDLLLPGAIVCPAVTDASYEYMRPYLGEVVLAETSQVVTDADKAYRTSGYERRFEALGVPWHNMTHHGWTAREIDGERLFIPDIVQSHQVINLCVMKTHFRSTISGALKNFWGFLESGREKFHGDLARKIAQIHSLIPSRLHIMDAVVAMEGNGPKSGRPKEVGLILASRDPVALDAVAARLMGFDPDAIEHIQVCAERGLGVGDFEKIELIGNAAQRSPMAFVPAKENFVARIESKMKRTRSEGRGLEGKPLQILSFGARMWYRFSYHAFGTKRRVDRFLKQTVYQGAWGER
jgi:uncharacterized protein (DUF362 family)